MTTKPHTLIVAVLTASLIVACSNREPAKEIEKKDSVAVEAIIDSVPVAAVTEKLNPPPPPPPPPMSVKPQSYTVPTIQTIEDEDESNSLNLEPDLPLPDAGVALSPYAENNEKIYSIVDENATFKGGQEAFMQFIENNLQSPSELGSEDVSGTTIVKFVVGFDGNLSNIRVGKSSGNSALDNEAVRVIKKTSGKWNPSKINGKPVSSHVSVPITFDIDE